MRNKLIYNGIIIYFLILIPSTYAAFYTNLQDDWDWDTGTNYDGKIWDDYIEGDYGTIIEIRGEDWVGDDADAVCLIYDQQDDNSFDYCFYDETYEDCYTVSPYFREGCDKGCQGGYSGQDIHITYNLDYDGHDVVYARMYFDCDESEGPYTYEDDYEWYYDYDARRTDCQSSGSDTFYHEAKDEYDESWDIFSTHYCSSEHNSYWGCATWDEETVYTAEDSFDEDPCKIKDGTTEDYACNSPSDCVSYSCDGDDLVYNPICYYDGSDGYVLHTYTYEETCGGEGYEYSHYEPEYECSQYLGSAYVCDDDLDEWDTWNYLDFCRKKEYASCSSDSQCWNDNGGYDCMGSAGNKICTTGANGKTCTNNDDLQCDSGRCDSTCQAKLSDGQSCNEDSDCINGDCDGGVCGGNKCDGTIDVLTEDNSNYPLDSLKVYLNDELDGVTDSIGQRILTLDDVDCDADQEVKIKCADDTTICGIKTTQIDFDGDSDSLQFDCTKCSSDNDLYISQSDVHVNVETNVVKATVHSTGITANVLVVLYRQDDEGIIKETDSDTISISAGSEKNATFNLNTLGSTDYLHIYVDSDNSVTNEDETNNYIFRAALKPIKAYIDVDVDPSFSVLDDLIKEYISSFVDSVSSTPSADVIIMVGHPYFSNSEPFILGKGKIIGDGKPIIRPYGGIVKSGPYFENEYSSSGKPYVLAYGNRIEGTIAAVKRMINARNIFLDKEAYDNYYESYIDDYDTLGISVMDLMHNNESQTYFTQNNEGFKETVRRVIFDNNFEVSVKPVKTLNTTSYGDSTILRVKHVNTDFSEDYKDAVGVSDKPVVMSRGIHSNLFTWEDFGKELAAEGYDSWLIEMVGGPYTDEEPCFSAGTCPDYTFADLKDYYWPALIAGVQEYSGKNQVDYVGFSLGCSAALESLESHQNGENNIGYYFDYGTGQYVYSDLSSSPVDTFVAIACPGNFTELPTIMDWLHYLDQNHSLISNLESKGKLHMTINDIKKESANYYSSWILLFPKAYVALKYIPFPSLKKMSINIYKEILNWMDDPTAPNLGNGVSLNKFVMLQGRVEGFIEEPILGSNSDMIVPNEDGRQICQNINSNDKIYGIFPNLKHFDLARRALPNRKIVWDEITKILDNKALQNKSYFTYNTNCEVIE